MAHSIPAHYFRRGNIFYFRQAIPPDLRHYFPTREYCHSLGTEIHTKAKQYSQELSAIIAPLFEQLRREPEMKSSEMINMLKQKSREIKLREKYEASEEALLNRTVELSAKLRQAQAENEALGNVHATIAAALSETKEQTALISDVKAAMLELPSLISAPTMPNEHSTATPAKPKMLLSEAIEYVKQEKEIYGKQSENSATEYAAAYALLLLIVGDKAVSDIEYEDARAFYQKVTKLPPNMKKITKYRGKSIDEIIAMGDTPISVRTAEKYIERASGLFDFLLRPAHKKASGISENPFAGISGNVSAAKNSDNAPAAEKRAYRINELQALFDHTSYTRKKFKTTYEYWLIPLALLTGARQNELCQLHLTDFVQQEGIWCINITDEEEEKKLKNRNAKRLVPIHDKLIQIGLLDYVTAMKGAGHTRLFPELKEGRRGHGDVASKWFARHRAKCAIKHEKHVTTFHALRRTFITALINNEVTSSLIAPIAGHEGELITDKVYFDSSNAAKRKETVMNKLHDFDTLIDALPHVNDITISPTRRQNFWTQGKLTGLAI